MATNLLKPDTSPFFALTTFVFSILAFNDDNLSYAVLGALAAFLGQYIFVGQRDLQDKDDTKPFFTWKDAYRGLGWTLAGGFFPLFLSLPDVPKHIGPVATPWLAVFGALFISKIWSITETVLEAVLPVILKFWLSKLGKRNELHFEETEREREREKAKQRND